MKGINERLESLKNEIGSAISILDIVKSFDMKEEERIAFVEDAVKKLQSAYNNTLEIKQNVTECKNDLEKVVNSLL